MIRRISLYLVVFQILFLTPICIFAAVPNISYSPATNTLTLGTAFSITPANSGGAVTTGSFAPIYNFATVTDPWDVTVDASGNVYTISQSGNRIYKITPTGTITTLSTAVNGPTGIAIDAVGNIYVSNFNTGDVLKFDTSGALLATIGGFNQPYGISFDSSNNAYVADEGNNVVYKIAAGTTMVTTYVSGLTTPYGTSVDAAGNLYVTQLTPNNIIKVAAGTLTKTTLASGFNGPRQLGIDAAGNLYVADYGNNAIKKVTTPGGVVTTVTTATGLTNPRSAQTDAVGSFYIADYGNNRIKKVAATGWVISGTLPAGLTFNTSTGVISGTPTATFSSTSYNVIAYNTSGKSNVTTITLSCSQITLDWKGTTSTAWTTTTNWQPNGTPGPYTAVRIGSNVTFTNQPTLTGNATVSTVTFGTTKTATLTLATGSKLTINDALTVNTGGATPTIKGTTTTSAVDLAPGSLLNISGTSTLTLTSPLTVTLKSDATGDASIGQIKSTSIVGTAAGSVNVERYLTGGSLTYRGYRLLSSPVYVGTDTHSNNCASLNYIINSSFITGTDGVSGGFDKPGNPSLYLFRENLVTPDYTTFTGSNYRGIKNINQSPAYSYLVDNDAGTFYIPVGNGFMFFFRGSRATSSPYTTTTIPLAATLTATGTLNAGQITVKDWFTPTSSNLSLTAGAAYAGYNLVGNPYASAIDWDTYQTTSIATGGIYGKNLDGTIWMMDPVTKNFGSYISGSGGVGSATFMSNIIQSGQSFFVVASAANPQLVFTESAKTNTQNQGATLLLGTPVNASVNQYIRLQLGQDAANSDQTLIRFNNQATPVYNSAIDAPYRTGFGSVNLMTRSADKVDLSINTVPLPKLQPQIIPLNINASADGIYQLSLRDIVAVPQLYDIWLMDKYAKDSIDMKQHNTYGFNILKTDSASFGPNRFEMVIRQNPLYAYYLASFDAQKVENAKQVQIVWQAKNEGNYTHFTVEHSIDGGKIFEVLGGINASGASKYSLVDKSPITGQNLYRLKQEDINNTISYSKVVGVSYSDLSNKVYINNLSIYPNPVTGSFSLAIDSKYTGEASYNISIMNSSGTIVKSVTSQQPSWQGSVSNLKPGVYMVNVVNSKTGTAVGETKFVKL